MSKAWADLSGDMQFVAVGVKTKLRGVTHVTVTL